MKRERGEVTTTVLAVPIAMFLIFITIQAALVFHARAVVDAAAQNGALAGQSEMGTEAAVHSAVWSIIGPSEKNLLSDMEIAIETNPSRLSVTVHATVKSLIPGFAPKIASTAAGPREVFISRSRR